MMSGKNAMTVAGELKYIPSPLPFNFPEVLNCEEINTEKPECEILHFNKLNSKNILECLTKVCPGFESDGIIINMNHRVC